MGLRYSIADWVVRKVGHRRFLTIIRNNLARKLTDELGLVVRYGPFKGTFISNEKTWSSSDSFLKILGLYEKPIQNRICKEGPFKRGFFVGASDGYFPIGCLVSGLVSVVFCWDIDPRSRRALASIAYDNGVGDRVNIFGEAGPDFLNESVGLNELNSEDVVLIDIEGCEFEILTDNTFRSFGNAFAIIELHTKAVERGDVKLEEILTRCKRHGSAEIITDVSRDISGITELADLTDDERNILCSEGREYQMQWLVFHGNQSR